MIALERQEAMRETAPRVTSRGHLELVDWASPKTAQAAPEAVRVMPLADPVRRLPVDRWFDRSVLLLLAASVAAICACMTHL